MRLTDEEEQRLAALEAPLLADEQVRSMAGFVQHGCVSTLEHVRSVARLAFALNARLHLGASERVLVTGALLHDFYLYDWHGAGWRHSYRHAALARDNAVRRFDVDEATQRVIESHMWPISPLRFPASREALIVCVADKVVSTTETLTKRRSS